MRYVAYYRCSTAQVVNARRSRDGANDETVILLAKAPKWSALVQLYQEITDAHLSKTVGIISALPCVLAAGQMHKVSLLSKGTLVKEFAVNAAAHEIVLQTRHEWHLTWLIGFARRSLLCARHGSLRVPPNIGRPCSWR